MSDLNLKFQVECKETRPGEEVYIVGSSNELGNWNVNNSQKLSTDSSKFPLWESHPILFQSKFQLEYKYIIKNSSNNVKWENFSGNRSLNLSNLENCLYLISDGKFDNKSKQNINKSNESLSPVHKSKNNKNIIKKKSNKTHNNNNNNYQYVNTNADEYVQSKRDEIKNIKSMLCTMIRPKM